MKIAVILLLVIIIVFTGFMVFKSPTNKTSKAQISHTIPNDPLAVEYMRKQNYLGSDITIEQTLEDGSNYNRYLTSYQSEGLKIYALLTVPKGEKPIGGFPVIVFNHGYIPPEVYKTTERYIAYVDAFARNGYIVFKPDYRGNGSSEGKPEGAYYSPAYTVDDLNAISSIKKYKDANPQKIGLWGHSMGGNISLRDLVTKPGDIKVAVIWGGVVGSYDEIMNHWHRTTPFQPSERERAARNSVRQRMTQQHGTPISNPSFWNSIDPTAYVKDITAPIQIHQGEADEEVPPEFAKSLFDKLIKAGKKAELYTYSGADHNISSPSFETAMERSLKFFDTYLKPT